MLPSVSNLLQIYRLQAKQKLSQNFILDKNITDRIVRLMKIKEKSFVMEIGSGPGLLTRSIIDAKPMEVMAVEKDKRFMPALDMLSTVANVSVVNADILEFNHNLVYEKARNVGAEHIHIVGNLPFAIASPLLINYLRAISRKEHIFQMPVTLTLMFQKEVADRIVAKPKTSDRTSLSVLAETYADCRIVYKLPSSVFMPRPKVDAGVVQINPKNSDVDFAALNRLLRLCFSNKRKLLTNNLKPNFKNDFDPVKAVLEELNIGERARAEELSEKDFYRMLIAFQREKLLE